MIIECVNCFKKFTVNSELIPSNGRNIQCGSCNHTWFFIKKDLSTSDNNNDISINKERIKHDKLISDHEIVEKKINDEAIEFTKNNKNEQALVRNEKNKRFTLSIFFSYFLVLIITFVAIVVTLDTLKGALINIFPNLELLLFNLFETLKDLSLFIKDLI